MDKAQAPPAGSQHVHHRGRAASGGQAPPRSQSLRRAASGVRGYVANANGGASQRWHCRWDWLRPGAEESSATVIATLMAFSIVALLTSFPSPGVEQGIRATPQAGTSGQPVALIVTGCVGPATAVSDAFSDARLVLRASTGYLIGDTRVAGKAAPGAYPVTVTCAGGGPFHAAFRVLAPKGTADISPMATPSSAESSAEARRVGWMSLAVAAVVFIAAVSVGLVLPRQRGRRSKSRRRKHSPSHPPVDGPG
jgi:hypothetical protein